MIVVENLTKKFGSSIAVNDLSFEARPGRVTGFLGPNGSGKSTTMRCMLGLDFASAGKSTFNGKSYEKLTKPLNEVGALLDAGNAHNGRTARNHLRWLAQSNGIATSRIDEVLALVGLSDVAKRRVGKFSLGMKQRLGIASVMLGNPHTVILDEPGNGLDPEGIRWVREMLQGFAAEGRSVLVSSHLMSEMSVMADDLVVIGQGRLITQCSVNEFIHQHATRWVSVASPQLSVLLPLIERAGGEVSAHENNTATVNGLDAAVIGELAASSSIVLHQLATQTGSLEEAFLQATASSVEYRGISEVAS